MAEWQQVLADAQLIAGGLLVAGEPAGYVAFVPGSAGQIQALPLPGVPGPVAPAVAGVVPGSAVAGGALPAAGVAAGAGGALGPAGADNMQMKSMAEAVEQLQMELKHFQHEALEHPTDPNLSSPESAPPHVHQVGFCLDTWTPPTLPCCWEGF